MCFSLLIFCEIFFHVIKISSLLCHEEPYADETVTLLIFFFRKKVSSNNPSIDDLKNHICWSVPLNQKNPEVYYDSTTVIVRFFIWRAHDRNFVPGTKFCSWDIFFAGQECCPQDNNYNPTIIFIIMAAVSLIQYNSSTNNAADNR